MNDKINLLGIVENGQFCVLLPADRAGQSPALTADSMVVGHDVKSMPLEQYEGTALMVRGYEGGNWIYEAKVIDQARPILTAVVQQVLGQATKGTP